MKMSIDPDKAATTPVVVVFVKGVRVSSRYQKQDEIVRMTRAIAAMPESLSRAIEEFWCNSKHTHQYNVEIRASVKRREVRQAIAAWLDAWMLAKHGGHNGVHVGDDVEACPNWSGDDAV